MVADPATPLLSADVLTCSAITFRLACACSNLCGSKSTTPSPRDALEFLDLSEESPLELAAEAGGAPGADHG